MVAPTIPRLLLVGSMFILMNLPKREELSFLRVRALPKDSRRGLEDNTLSSSVFCFSTLLFPVSVLSLLLLVLLLILAVESFLCILARYCIIFLVASVFPAPDSPEMTMD